LPDRHLHLLLPALFLLVAGQLGVFLALAVPLGQVPDETTHITRAESLLRGEILGHRELTPTADNHLHLQQGIDADPGLQMVGGQMAGGAATLTQADWDRAKAQPWFGPAFLSIGTIASYWPVFYAPAAVGIGLAKAAGESPFNAFRVARMANLATFLLLGTAALLLARRGQALLFCTLSVPMTLNLAASANQDGLIIAASALAAALLTLPGRAGHRHDLPRLAAAALLGSIAMAKPPYLPLVGVLLLPFPPWRQRRVWLQRLGLGLLAAAATLAWVAVTLRGVSTPGIRMPAEAGPLWPGPRPAVFSGMDMGAQLRVLLAKPTRLLTLPWRSQLHDRQVWREAVGVLGHLNVRLPPWLYWLWALSLAAAALADAVGRRAGAAVLPWRQAAWPLLCVAAAWLGIYLSQYLTWSPVGNALIDGAQGRYLLPLLPVLALALPSLPAVPALRVAAATFPAAACLAGAAAVPVVIIRFYYLH